MASKPDMPFMRKAKSLESQLKTFGWILLVAIGGLLGWVMYLLDASTLVVLTVCTLVLLPFGLCLGWFYRQLSTPFYRLTTLVEAIRLEDHSLRAHNPYQGGVVHDLYQEIGALADDLQQRKDIYSQHSLLIYHLIEQLDTPIAVFSEKLLLSHANAAFSQHLNKPWQSMRHGAATRLGMMFDENKQWVFTQAENAHSWQNGQNWQIRQSHFIQDGQKYHLVILIDIEHALREQQQQSWQQIIRVMTHEINNSLTPIKSLAQTLAAQPGLEPRSQQALNVIVDRSVSLQQFVSRYGSIGKRLTLQQSWIDSKLLERQLSTLFTTHPIEVENQVDKIWADPVLLEQVLINLLKNAAEASEVGGPAIKLTLKQQKNHILIEVQDRGQGIANEQNLFIPLYTTKPNGSGIGLGLCRNIVEQHGGRLSLVNNKDGAGAVAGFSLPLV
ncbi:MAG: HAMP domain-containing histidine kinase [Algicola sp.]|nr:HAMP domain-containing histidine kinase [Algicola sp.]